MDVSAKEKGMSGKVLLGALAVACAVSACVALTACQDGASSSSAGSMDAVSTAQDSLSSSNETPDLSAEYLIFQQIGGKEEYAVVGLNKHDVSDITIPETYQGLPVTEIGAYAFINNTALTNVVIGDSVTSIGKQAFFQCDGLTDVAFGDAVKSIGEKAFYDCNALTRVDLGQALSEIGANAFASCGNLTDIALPDTVTVIGARAFYECKALKNVDIGDLVTRIERETFYGCERLESVMIGEAVTIIDSQAFVHCSALEYVVIGSAVEGIWPAAFVGCHSLNAVYYMGTETEWHAIEGIAAMEQLGGDAVLDKVERYYYCEADVPDEGNWWRYVDGKPEPWRFG
jgi:hypothetical protein